MRRNLLILPVLGTGLLLAALLARTVLAHSHAQHPQVDAGLLLPFQNSAVPSADNYEGLAIYFMQGFESRKTKNGAGAEYKGMPSFHGAEVDRMEAFSRMAPLWASWVASGRQNEVKVGTGRTISLTETFRRGLLAGTDPRSKEYWGEMHDGDQRIVEASDIALSLWLMRAQVWQKFTSTEKQQVVAWLQQVNGKQIPDNNWHLFVVLVDAVLKNLSGGDNAAESQRHYERIKSFYRGDGWFSDGPGEMFDYYNAWGIHYQLFWLQQIDPAWDRDFISQARHEFVSSYRYLMTPNGMPIMGRSVCYRMAAPVPLLLEQFDAAHGQPGEARRALDATWEYFLQHQGANDGNITQGYCGSDARVLDNYSGPASCLWGLRSLIVALHSPRDSEFWKASPTRLPVERSDFSVEIKSSGWRLTGNKRTGEVEIQMPRGARAWPLESYAKAAQAKDLATGSASRPDNHAAKYERASYSSNYPFCGCK